MTDLPHNDSNLKMRQGTSLVDRVNVFIRFRKYFKLIGRRWWILLLGGGIGFGYNTYQAKQLPDLYRATSTMAVTARVTVSNDPRAIEDEMLNYIDNQLRFMGSKEVHDQIKQRMAGRPEPTQLSANAHPGTGASFVMEVVSTDLSYAKDYAQFWPQEFLNFKNRDKEDLLSKSAAKIRQDVLQLEQKLEKERKQRASRAREAAIR